MKKQGFAAHMNARQSSTSDTGVIEGDMKTLKQKIV